MTFHQLSLTQFKNLLATSLALVSFTSFPTQVLSQVSFTPPMPPDRGAPGQQSDAGTRGPCDSNNESNLLSKLVALVPTVEKPLKDNSEISLPETDVWGLTSAQHPTLWFYIPSSATVAKEAKFILEDEENYRSEFRFALPKTAGIVSLSIPSTEKPLEIGKRYHWSLKIYCNPSKSQSPNFTVDGWIQKVNLETPVNGMTPQEKINFYSQHGIWFDTLTEVANLHRTSGKDTVQSWTDLLKVINWENLAQEPIVSCCTLEKL